MKQSWILVSMLFLGSCTNQMDFDLQGHRGARGRMPENSIEGFLYAIDQRVTTLEMDVVISKDHQVVVSHDPYMSSIICMNPEGKIIKPEDQADNNIFEMDYEVIKQYDCGLLPHPDYAKQFKTHVFKPLLKEVFQAVDQYPGGSDMKFNIELKSQEKTDTIYHPIPADFSELVHQVIDNNVNWDRVTIQSFDFRILRYYHENYPKVKLALLVENELSIQENLDSLGFIPDIYSCYYPLLNQDNIIELHEKGMKVIPWTVNDKVEMQKLMKWGVDGLITDYPDVFWRD